MASNDNFFLTPEQRRFFEQEEMEFRRDNFWAVEVNLPIPNNTNTNILSNGVKAQKGFGTGYAPFVYRLYIDKTEGQGPYYNQRSFEQAIELTQPVRVSQPTTRREILFEQITPGDYIVAVEDKIGNIDYTQIRVWGTLEIFKLDVLNSETWAGDMDGKIRVIVQSGIPPYTLTLFTNGQQYQTAFSNEVEVEFDNLPAGNWILVVKDTTSAQVTRNFTIQAGPRRLTLKPLRVIQHEQVRGNRDGILSLEIDQGEAPLTIQLLDNNNQTVTGKTVFSVPTGEIILSDLPAGTYSYRAFDPHHPNALFSLDLDVVADREATIETGVPELILDAIVVNQVDKITGGSIEARVSGGQSPIYFRLARIPDPGRLGINPDYLNWRTSFRFNNLAPGEYWLEAKDSGVIVQQVKNLILEIEAAPAVPFLVTVDRINQVSEWQANDASISVNTSGGFGQIRFLILTYEDTQLKLIQIQNQNQDGGRVRTINPPNNNISNLLRSANTDTDIFSWNTVGIFDGLGPGVYQIMAADQEGQISYSELINIVSPEPPPIAVIDIEVTDQQALNQKDGRIIVIAETADLANTRYELISSRGLVVEVNNTGVFDNLAPSVYTIRIDDGINPQYTANFITLEPVPGSTNFV